MKMKHLCPVCGELELVSRNDHVYEFTAARQKQTVTGLEHSVCNACGTSICTEEQLDRNAARIEEFQARLPGYISPEKVCELRSRYNLTQAMAAKIFGGGPNAFSKYERGEVTPSASAASIMLLALESPIVFRELAKLRGVSLGKDDCVDSSDVKWVDLRLDVVKLGKEGGVVAHSGRGLYAGSVKLGREHRFGCSVQMQEPNCLITSVRPQGYVGTGRRGRSRYIAGGSNAEKYLSQPFHKIATTHGRV